MPGIPTIDPTAEVALCLADAACKEAGMPAKAVSYIHVAAAVLRAGSPILDKIAQHAVGDADKLSADMLRRAKLTKQRDLLSAGMGRRRALIRKPVSSAIQHIMKTSQKIMPKGSSRITDAVLLAACAEGSSIVASTLKKYGLDPRALLTPTDLTQRRKEGPTPSTHPNLFRYAVSLNERAAAGELDLVVGREDVIVQMVDVLGKRKKRNPLLLGEPGVGKTAIVEKLASMIVTEDPSLPPHVLEKELFTLEMSTLVAGTIYRGQFEERMKNLIHEITDEPNIALYVDEFHTILGAGNAQGSIDASNMLKPALARGSIQIIGATTEEEYKKHVERDRAFERRVHPIMVEAPSKAELIKILKSVKLSFELFHGVVVTDGAITTAMNLAERFYREQHEPDRTIDILDGTCSMVKSRPVKEPKRLRTLRSKITRLRKKVDDFISRRKFVEAARAKADVESTQSELSNLLSQQGTKAMPKVTKDDVAAKIASAKGLEIEVVKEDEAGKLLRLEDILHQDVVGQDAAVTALCDAIRRNRVGLRDPKRPIGVFLFLGPTGVGKTHVCKKLAKVLFGDEGALIQEDMGDYSENHSTARVTGSPPGYVGYDDQVSLASKIRSKPHGVLLLDEIEKASPSVHNNFLHAFNDGTLRDSHQRVADLRNYIIIMTSNVGSMSLVGQNKITFLPEVTVEEEMKETVKDLEKEVKKFFSPEFLNRIDDIIVFSTLGKAELVEVAKMVFEEVSRDSRYNAYITDDAARYVAEEGYDKDMGARAIRRALIKVVDSPLAVWILKNGVKEGSTVLVDYKEGVVVFSQPANEVEEELQRGEKEKVG